MSDQPLNADQAHALLDILSHEEVYSEIRDFRFPGTLSKYGPPFQASNNQPSSCPSLQSLVSKFLLNLPGLRDVSQDFWQKRIGTIIEDLQKAELSESYDKGSIGIRKTLSTAVSALVEYLVRGVFAGFQEPGEDAKKYDKSNADDLQRAFRDFTHEAVYGDMIDKMFVQAEKTDKLSEHEPVVQAAHEYLIVNLASFMHYILIISPKGQSLLSLVENANRLVPYGMIRQTLKIGNVASMINAMMKVVLAKLSVASVTNWMGFTSHADEGMNLMQQIISTVLGWDTKDFKSRVAKIEKANNAPEREQLTALRDYLELSREQHQKIRDKSLQESKSIIEVILAEASVSTKLTHSQHKQAQDYLAVQLSIRDRDQIIKVLCHSSPDQLTQTVRDVVSAYEPIIRHVHEAVDLSATVGDLEYFIKDMIRLSKAPERTKPSAFRGRSSSKESKPVPTVGDFVQLLKKHQGASHRFVHQCAKNGKEVTSWFHEYAKDAASQFRRSPDAAKSDSTSSSSGAGSLTVPIQQLFSSLPKEKREFFLPVLDAHALYLSKAAAASTIRFRTVVSTPPSHNPALQTPLGSRASSPAPGSSPTSRNHSSTPSTPIKAVMESDPGPGAYLARWQNLLDGTEITPGAQGGRVRHAGDGSVLKASRAGAGAPELQRSSSSQSLQSKADDTEDDEAFEDAHESLDELGLEAGDKVEKPDVRPIVEALGKGFRVVLGKIG